MGHRCCVLQALSKTGSILGTSQLRVLPSKTAIVPVNKELMPRSHEELERCSRTVYVANIDKKVEREDVRNFFEQLCGKVGKIRLLGDVAHSTRIAFIEFIQAEAAMAALNCSGALLGEFHTFTASVRRVHLISLLRLTCVVLR